MKVPIRWCADYVDIETSKEAIDRLAERLTLAGREVEGIEETGTLRGVVAGSVTSVRSHPNADKLVLCSVDVGTRSVEVVCGARNVVEGALVPVALDGAELPIGLKIEKRKVRGELSDGMICSKQELALEEKSDGIWILDPALGIEVGADLAELLEYDDVIFDFKVTSNRPDCASIYGVAREVAAVLNLPLRPLETTIEETGAAAADRVRIVIEDGKDTPRYAARLMEGVEIGPSPLRVQHRLVKAGMRPLSNVVDATNYAMLELGQPLHPFDAEGIGDTISIRRATEGEPFRTLDGVDRKLTTTALVIADDSGAIALAGVMGGERGEIEPTTTRVLLEVATFNSFSVRQSSRSVGLRTEASQRFERGLDPESVPMAADRAAYWIQKLTGCRILEGLADAYPVPREKRKLTLRPHRVAEVLGIEVPIEEMVDILRRIDVNARVENDEILAVIPTFRADLEREVDLIEEIGRIHGYDRFPTISPRMTLRVGRKDRMERGKDRIREILAAQGLFEVMTDGFDKPDWRGALGLEEADLVTVRNPMAATQNAMRLSLLPGVLGVVETNLSVGVDGGSIFELGRIFSKSKGERESLAGAFFGRTRRALAGKELVELGEGKGVLESLFGGLKLGDPTTEQAKAPAYLHPGRSAAVRLDETPVGHIGELAPHLTERLSVSTPVLLFEFDSEALLTHFEDPISFQEIPNLPASKRDLSLTAPAGLPEGEVRRAIESEPTLESILLYDVYEGEQVAAGRKSLTYEVSFRATDHTLTDEEVSDTIGRIEKRLQALDVHLRTG